MQPSQADVIAEATLSLLNPTLEAAPKTPQTREDLALFKGKVAEMGVATADYLGAESTLLRGVIRAPFEIAEDLANPLTVPETALGNALLSPIIRKFLLKKVLDEMPLYPKRPSARGKMVQQQEETMGKMGFFDEPPEITKAFSSPATRTVIDPLKGQVKVPVQEVPGPAVEAKVKSVIATPSEINEVYSKELSLGSVRSVVEAATDLLNRNPEYFVQGEDMILLFRRIGNDLRSGNIGWSNFSPEQVAKLKTVFFTPGELAGDFEQAISYGAKEMNRVGQFAKMIKQAARGSLQNVPTPPQTLWGKMTGWALKVAVKAPRDLINTARQSLVTQLSIQVRNLIMGSGEQGVLEGIDEAMLAVEKRLLGRVTTAQAFAPIFEHAWAITRRFSKEGWNQLSEFLVNEPLMIRKLYGTPTAGEFLLTSKYQKLLGWFTNLQEFAVRNVVVDTNISKELLYRQPLIAQNWWKMSEPERRAAMQSLWKSYKPEERFRMLDKAIDGALDVTKAATPKLAWARSLVKAINAFPPILLLYPFPRAAANFVGTIWRYSPAKPITMGLKYTIPQFRQQIKEQSFEETMKIINRGIEGSLMFYGAYQLRNSKWAGEKWNQLKTGTIVPEGRLREITALLAGGDEDDWDSRPFNPFFPSYLFVGEFIKRYKRKMETGEPIGFTMRDYVEGSGLMSRAAGTTLFLLSQLEHKSPEELEEVLGRLAGEFLGWFSAPAGSVRDLLTPLFPEQGRFKDVRQAPLSGPFLERIPFARDMLPEKYFATGVDNTRYKPATRQLTGMSFENRTPFQRELDRLKIGPQMWEPRTGDAELDNLVREKMGPELEVTGQRLMDWPNYEGLSDKQKAEKMRERIRDAKAKALRQVLRENPDLKLLLEEKKAEKGE